MRDWEKELIVGIFLVLIGLALVYEFWESVKLVIEGGLSLVVLLLGLVLVWIATEDKKLEKELERVQKELQEEDKKEEKK